MIHKLMFCISGYNSIEKIPVGLANYPSAHQVSTSLFGLFFYSVGLRYPPHFDFQNQKKKDLTIGKICEMLQNDCLACCLHILR